MSTIGSATTKVAESVGLGLPFKIFNCATDIPQCVADAIPNTFYNLPLLGFWLAKKVYSVSASVVKSVTPVAIMNGAVRPGVNYLASKMHQASEYVADTIIPQESIHFAAAAFTNAIFVKNAVANLAEAGTNTKLLVTRLKEVKTTYQTTGQDLEITWIDKFNSKELIKDIFLNLAATFAWGFCAKSTTEGMIDVLQEAGAVYPVAITLLTTAAAATIRIGLPYAVQLIEDCSAPNETPNYIFDPETQEYRLEYTQKPTNIQKISLLTV